MGTCQDEPEQLDDWNRIAELQQRNRVCPPHLKTCYPLESRVSSGPMLAPLLLLPWHTTPILPTGPSALGLWPAAEGDGVLPVGSWHRGARGEVPVGRPECVEEVCSGLLLWPSCRAGEKTTGREACGPREGLSC